jgi:hypothetical protein
MEDKKINEQESLELISRMIRNTQRKMEQGSGAPMIIWGSATVITTVIIWIVLRLTHDPNWHHLWFLIPVAGGAGTLMRKKRPKVLRTYLNRVIDYIWLVLGVTGFILSALSILRIMWQLPILFIILLIMGMGTILTGLLSEFKPFTIGGVIGMLLSVVQYLSPDFDTKMLTFALAFFIMMIIPGCILNRRAKRHAV